MVVGLNALETAGAASTVSVAVLLAAPARSEERRVGKEGELLLSPGLVLETLNVTVQLRPGPAGMLIQAKLSSVTPAHKLFGVVPVQVPTTDPPAALIFTRVSVNAPPESAVALLFDSVTVTVDDPPD